MEQAIAQIKTALINSLSMDQTLREQANQFLIKQCEPDPQFQIALLHIIKSFATTPSPNTVLEAQAPGESPQVFNSSSQAAATPKVASPEEIQIQYQAIICMKNSLTRLMQQHRKKPFTYARQQQQTAAAGASILGSKAVTFAASAAAGKREGPLPDELRNQIKAQLLQMIDNPENVILSKSCYEQLTLVVTIFVKYDFPVAWPQMNQWLIKSLDTLHANMQNLQLEDAPRVQRFLGFYLEVLKEQRKKQLKSSKSHFQKMSKDHLKGIVRVWLFFNDQQSKMILNQETQELQPLAQTYNETLFMIAAKLDKLLMNIVGCGFSINNLVAEPDNNQFVETVTHLIQKLKLFVNCMELVSNLPASDDKEKFGELIVGQIKTFLRNLCLLQSSEPLLMFNSLDQYLQILARILHRQEIYPVRVKKLALIATFKVVNVDCFNQGSKRDATGHSDGIGILVSPVKFKNLEPQIAQASELYRQVMEVPIPSSDLVEEQTRQDGARKILELVSMHFLSQVDLSSWQSDPEYFIENEDEQFLLEYDLQDDCSLNLLAQHLIEKLLQKFYPTCYPFVQEILNQYFNGSITPETVQIEDALLNLVGIVGKVQKEFKVKLEKRLDVNFVLQFIKTNKWTDPEKSPIFRRRFLLILTHWVKILPKPVFFDLLNSTLESLSTLGQSQAMPAGSPEGVVAPLSMTTLEQVLVFEHSLCVHEMLKELHFWLDRADQYKKGTSTQTIGELPKDIFELRGTNDRFTESEEEQITHCQYINSQINYAQLFQLVGSKLVPLLDVFKSPSLIWSMINCLSYILEKTVSDPQMIEGCLKYLNILRILEQQTECHVDDAIIDMLKNLLIQCPSSAVILDMCCTLLNFKLAKTLNDGSTMQFWLFTMRAVSADNPSVGKLKELFVRFSGCLSSGSQGNGSGMEPTGSNSVAYSTIKRDYIFLEFLKVAKECVLLDMFATFEEAAQLTQFATVKFESEIEREQKAFDGNSNGGASSGGDSGYDSDGDGGNFDSAMYEKKELILRIPHIIMWKVESTPAVDATLQQQKQLLVQCCAYLIQSRAKITLSNSNLFFQQLVTYLNRILIIRPNDFVNGILEGEIAQRGFTLAQFVEAWLQKMEMIVQWEAHRIKTLALLIMMPFLTGDILRTSFGEIGKLAFAKLEDDLYYKLTNEKTKATYSPSRFAGSNKQDMTRNPNAVNIKIHEKLSQRYEKMKREDWLLETDLMDLFWQKVRDLMAKLQIQTIDPLVECLPTDHLKQQFTNLVNGYSPKFEQMKADQAREQQQLADQQASMLEQQQQQQVVPGANGLPAAHMHGNIGQ